VKEVTEKAKGKEQNELQQLLEQFQKQIQEAGQLHKLPIECLVLPDGILDKLARRFAQKLNATQLRRVFHDLKRLELRARHCKDKESFDEIRVQIALVLPELAYACGREVIPDEFYKLMRTLLNPPEKRFQEHEDVKRLLQVLTALLAYHKFRGGK